MKKIIPFLFVLSAACPRTGSQADAVTRSYWLGWYEKGHKVGYMQSIFQAHADRYRFERRGKLTTEMMGNIVTAAPVTVCNTDKTFALKDFDFIMETPGHRFHVSGAGICGDTSRIPLLHHSLLPFRLRLGASGATQDALRSAHNAEATSLSVVSVTVG